MEAKQGTSKREITYKIHKAVFLLDKLSDQILQCHQGLGFSQFLVLMVLNDQPKAPQKLVANRLDQTQAAVSRQIDILADLGLISRERNPEAKREYVLKLTTSGRNKFKDGLAELDKRLGKLFDIWSGSEKNNLAGCLDRLIIEIREKGTEAICGSPRAKA